MYVAAKRATRLPTDPSLAFCYDVLNRVSRSFAVVIQQLPQPLRDAVCVFYLVLRGLDTVEDDMALDEDFKVPALLEFHERIFERWVCFVVEIGERRACVRARGPAPLLLGPSSTTTATPSPPHPKPSPPSSHHHHHHTTTTPTPPNSGFHMQGVGYGEYVRLMQRFATVVDAFLALHPKFQDVIADITKRMGAGMAEFIADKEEVRTVAEYDLYCHYVAGLVGVGLSQLFAACGLEDARLGARSYEPLSNHMGLFLQKANIIRDYLEDIEEEPAPRMFWPRDVWGKYCKDLEDLKAPGNRARALAALDDLVTDALRHLPYCVQYLENLRDRDVFRFCAIPQVMAVATYSMCYDNGKVFEGVVKMRRGETAAVFGACGGMADVLRWFLKFLAVMRAKAAARLRLVESGDDLVMVKGQGQAEALRRVRATQRAVDEAVSLCERELRAAEEEEARSSSGSSSSSTALDASLVVLAGAWAYSAFGLALAGGYAHAGGHPLVPDDLARGPLGALAGLGGSALPVEYAGAEKALALVLLVAALWRLVFGREAARAV
jgi:farnesyl-diphosphate farnesyltransferase